MRDATFSSAALMLNFDLPWNPQRIEQRVGRIHRVGQTRPVEIWNLSAEGTIEDYLLEVLDRKAEHVRTGHRRDGHDPGPPGG